ncbi:Uncharacterized protein BM_BM1321 [Brugia malayi]|uniref:Bm1321 n=1 Tax=Brugia malayi TaxID=6279 RepID=A0A4E9FUV3_BRUMA|nr:Uncharacterized protein BM_BM1321 [Brugia malayi]VIO99664.1 Uncharacterized protein BM_BM1321 [Brugia malayi]
MISFFRKIYLNERIQRLEELSFREENSRQSPLISSYIKDGTARSESIDTNILK